MSNSMDVKTATRSLIDAGFKCDESGEYTIQGQCCITFYSSEGEWEVDLCLPNGEHVSLNVMPNWRV